MDTFGQLLEMDDDEDHSFSKALTWDYFDQVRAAPLPRACDPELERQAVATFNEMDAAVYAMLTENYSLRPSSVRSVVRASNDLLTLSRKGHFLKGSSAALGLNKVKASCEKMRGSQPPSSPL